MDKLVKERQELQMLCNDLVFKHRTPLEFRNKLHKMIKDCDDALLHWIAKHLH